MHMVPPDVNANVMDCVLQGLLSASAATNLAALFQTKETFPHDIKVGHRILHPRRWNIIKLQDLPFLVEMGVGGG